MRSSIFAIVVLSCLGTVVSQQPQVPPGMFVQSTFSQRAVDKWSSTHSATCSVTPADCSNNNFQGINVSSSIGSSGSTWSYGGLYLRVDPAKLGGFACNLVLNWTMVENATSSMWVIDAVDANGTPPDQMQWSVTDDAKPYSRPDDQLPCPPTYCRQPTNSSAAWCKGVAPSSHTAQGAASGTQQRFYISELLPPLMEGATSILRIWLKPLANSTANAEATATVTSWMVDCF